MTVRPETQTRSASNSTAVCLGSLVPMRAEVERTSKLGREWVAANLGGIGEERQHGVGIALLTRNLEAGEHVLPVAGRQGFGHAGECYTAALTEKAHEAIRDDV